MKPTVFERQRASSVCPMVAMSRPPMTIRPRVGESIPAIRFRSVVLPEPDGPISATYSPSGMSSWMPMRTGISIWSRR